MPFCRYYRGFLGSLVWYECMRMGYVGQPSHHHVCCLEERASCCCLQVIRGFSSHHHHQPQSWLLIGGDLGPVEASLVSDWPRRRGETGKLVLVSVPWCAAGLLIELNGPSQTNWEVVYKDNAIFLPHLNINFQCGRQNNIAAHLVWCQGRTFHTFWRDTVVNI